MKTEVMVVMDGFDSALEDEIIAKANELSGTDVAAGYGFGQRDIEFEFDTKHDANMFIEAVVAMNLSNVGAYLDPRERL